MYSSSLTMSIVRGKISRTKFKSGYQSFGHVLLRLLCYQMYQSGRFKIEIIWLRWPFFTTVLRCSLSIIIVVIRIVLIVSTPTVIVFGLKIAKEAICRVGRIRVSITFTSWFKEIVRALFLKKAKHLTCFLIFNIAAFLYIIITDEIDIQCKFTLFESFVQPWKRGIYQEKPNGFF